MFVFIWKFNTFSTLSKYWLDPKFDVITESVGKTTTSLSTSTLKSRDFSETSITNEFFVFIKVADVMVICRLLRNIFTRQIKKIGYIPINIIFIGVVVYTVSINDGGIRPLCWLIWIKQIPISNWCLLYKHSRLRSISTLQV